MTTEVLLVICLAVLVVAVLIGWYLSFLASRLDRLHRRVEGARLVLDNQLFQRSAATLELAGSGALDPASCLLLADAATDALAAGRSRQDAVVGDPFGRSLLADHNDEMERAESNLTRALAATVAGDGTHAVTDPAALAELSAACHRVHLARTFHNDAVLAAQAVRRKRVVRLAHLAGHAPSPLTVEFDDEIPRALGA